MENIVLSKTKVFYVLVLPSEMCTLITNLLNINFYVIVTIIDSNEKSEYSKIQVVYYSLCTVYLNAYLA